LPRAPSNLVTPLAARQPSPNPRTLGKAATIVSYRVCHILGEHNEPFEDGDILKEAFLETANSLFENFDNKT